MLRLNLIVDDAERGSWNMAVDEALLEQAAADGTSTLRFYRWNEPTLSLGYFQAYADRQQHATSLDCPLVRRASGGGALVHDRELTYSFTAPIGDRAASSVELLYDAFHQTMIDTLASFDVTASQFPATDVIKRADEPLLCFERRSAGDLICRDAKILGSAQRRRRSAVLQHGGLLLAQSEHAPELPGIAELSGKQIEPSEVVDRWVPMLEARLEAECVANELPAVVIDQAETIEREKFAAESWTRRR